MTLAQAALYIVAIVMLVLAGLGVPARVSWGYLGAACALLAYTLPGLLSL